MNYQKQVAPIGIVFYRRLDKINRLIESLRVNPEATSTEIYIFSDGANSEDDRQYFDEMRYHLKRHEGFHKITVIEHGSNLGREQNAKFALDYLRTKFPFFIFMEDDLIVSSGFLGFMNHCLKYYYHDREIQSIGGYNAPINQQCNGLVKHKIMNAWGVGYWSHKPFLDKLFEKKNFYHDMIRSNSIQKVVQVHNFLPVHLKKMANRVRNGDYIGTYLNCKYNWVQLRPFRTTIINDGFDGSGENCGVSCYFEGGNFDNVAIDNKNKIYESKFDLAYKAYFDGANRTTLGGIRRELIRRMTLLHAMSLIVLRRILNSDEV